MKRPVRIVVLCLGLLLAFVPVASFAIAANSSRDRAVPDGEILGYGEDGGMFILIAGPYGSAIVVYWIPEDTNPFEGESGFVDR